MLKNLIELIRSILKAIFKFRHANAEEQSQEEQTHQQELQDDYNKIDADHQVQPNQPIQDIADELNDRF
jgi:Sec-independent protein translocase protein TatA